MIIIIIVKQIITMMIIIIIIIIIIVIKLIKKNNDNLGNIGFYISTSIHVIIRILIKLYKFCLNQNCFFMRYNYVTALRIMQL